MSPGKSLLEKYCGNPECGEAFRTHLKHKIYCGKEECARYGRLTKYRKRNQLTDSHIRTRFGRSDVDTHWSASLSARWLGQPLFPVEEKGRHSHENMRS